MASAEENPALQRAVDASARDINTRLESLRAEHALGTLPMLAAPVILPAAERKRLGQAAETIWRALLRLAGDAQWPPGVPVPAGLDALLTSEPHHLPRLGSCRFDALYDPGSRALQFVEVQAGDPSGAAWVDGIGAALASVPALQTWMRHADGLVAAHRRHVLDTYNQGPAPNENPLIAFVTDDAGFVRSDHDLWAWLYRAAGSRAVRLDPRTPTLDGTRLLANGEAVHLVIRDTHEELTISPGPVATDCLRRALLAGLPRFNPFSDVWFDDKSCFVSLCERADAFPDDERQAILAHLPTTRHLTERAAEDVRRCKDAWVVKPADGYGGFGISIGRDVTQAAWESALNAGIQSRCLLQAYVPVPRMRVARTTADGGVSWKEQHLTLSIWCHGGRMSGAYARAGDGNVVNVHQGGGIGPVVFTDA